MDRQQIQNQNQNPIQKDLFDRLLNTKDGKTLKYKFEKQLKFQNHLTIFKIHKDKDTTPASLFYNNFPRPFFGFDEQYVEKYNQIIVDFQNNTMQLIEETINAKLEILNNEIETTLNTIKQTDETFDEETIGDLNNYILKNEETNLKAYFMENKYKAQRCKRLKYEVQSNTRTPMRSNTNNYFSNQFHRGRNQTRDFSSQQHISNENRRTNFYNNFNDINNSTQQQQRPYNYFQRNQNHSFRNVNTNFRNNSNRNMNNISRSHDTTYNTSTPNISSHSNRSVHFHPDTFNHDY